MKAIIPTPRKASSRQWQIWGLAAVTLGAASCVTRGQNFSSKTNWLDEAKPSQTQVQQIMGTPYKVGSSNGTPTWTYGYYKHRLFGESQVKELKIYWAPDHKLKGYSFTSSFKEDTKPTLEASGQSPVTAKANEVPGSSDANSANSKN